MLSERCHQSKSLIISECDIKSMYSIIHFLVSQTPDGMCHVPNYSAEGERVSQTEELARGEAEQITSLLTPAQL